MKLKPSPLSLTPAGLVRDDFATLMCPVYMCIHEYLSFAPHAGLLPLPANPTTADEGYPSSQLTQSWAVQIVWDAASFRPSD
ncbi:hypothetical protein B0H16DRAFT_1726248 [Mycena metata]|uniref:Uncharacterized protein n=1 Tax=Mycena metata TaxID=1033252 RepID=A0AAD7IPW4_9AGAR|nr:hypothetical protein B0H16DRAFT_1726248 [Mycena metata]